MIRIFFYEIKRLIFNRLFPALMIITGIYGYMTLSSEIILGIASTAPFSPWSFAAYLAKVLPLLMLTLLFFITFMYSNNEKQVMQLTFASPADPLCFCLVKCAAITTGFLIMFLFIVTLSLIFYVFLFRFTDFYSFILPAVAVIVPCLLFVLGAGLLLGNVHCNIIYVIMAVILLLSFLPLLVFFDFYGSGFFCSYPLTLPAGPGGEPSFALPATFILGRVFFSGAGVLMILCGINIYKRGLL